MNQKLNEIIQKETPQPHDIFSGIIYYIPEEKSLGTASVIYKLLYELKQKYDSESDLLHGFTSCTDGMNPICGNTGQILWRLIYSHIICSNERGYIKHNDANKVVEDNVLHLFNKREREQLQMMAEGYVKILSKYLK